MSTGRSFTQAQMLRYLGRVYYKQTIHVCTSRNDHVCIMLQDVLQYSLDRLNPR